MKSTQYLKRSEIIIRTLGMIEINCQRTGLNLKDIIIDVLRSCGLKMENVYSCTTDNGANMIKASELFATAQEDLNLMEKNIVDEHLEEEEEKEPEDDDKDDEIDDDEDVNMASLEEELEELVSTVAR